MNSFPKGRVLLQDLITRPPAIFADQQEHTVGAAAQQFRDNYLQHFANRPAACAEVTDQISPGRCVGSSNRFDGATVFVHADITDDR